MYLSRIAIDSTDQRTLRALSNPEILHGMIESCFPAGRQRRLWRIDVLRGQLYLLLLSHEKPDPEPLVRQIGLPGAELECRSYQPLMDRILPGSVWRFRLVANPVVSVPSKNGERGKVKAITITAHQREWLVRQGEHYGFVLQDGHFDVVHNEWKIFRNKGKTVSILSADFEGALTVKEPEAFKTALENGIGRAKAYGMGLLTVMSCG